MAQKAMRARLRGIVNDAVLALRDFRANYVTSREAVWPTAGDSDGGANLPDHKIENWESSGDARCYREYQVARLAPHLKGGLVLEVGSQTGELAEMLRSSTGIRHFFLSERHPAWLQRLRHLYQAQTVLDLDLANRPLGLTVDSVLAVNVLGYIEDEDEKAALGNIRGMLAAGGRLVIWDAAHPQLSSEFDKMVGRARRYTRESLTEHLKAAGFEVETVRYINPLGAVFGWLLVRRMRDAADPRVVRLYDRLVVPVSRCLDNLPSSVQLSATLSFGRKRSFGLDLPFGDNMPFGQNIIAVAKVPEAPQGKLRIPGQRQR